MKIRFVAFVFAGIAASTLALADDYVIDGPKTFRSRLVDGGLAGKQFNDAMAALGKPRYIISEQKERYWPRKRTVNLITLYWPNEHCDPVGIMFEAHDEKIAGIDDGFRCRKDGKALDLVEYDNDPVFKKCDQVKDKTLKRYCGR